MIIKIIQINEIHLREAHKLYNYYIINSYANFEETEINFKTFYSNYKSIIDNNLPYLVALDNTKVIGIAYLNKFRDKSGYRFAFENTIYIKSEYIKEGIGSKLLEKLINISKKNKNIKKIVAVIGGTDSKGSLKLHQKFGFKKSGVLKEIGFKHNKWIDAIFMQKNI